MNPLFMKVILFSFVETILKKCKFNSVVILGDAAFADVEQYRIILGGVSGIRNNLSA